MTAFASGRGAAAGYAWECDLRSVNGKGLDLRLRVPDWIEGLEAALRARLGKVMARGNVTLNLRVQSEEQTGGLVVNEAQLGAALDALARVESEALARGLTLSPAGAGEILGLRGVVEAGTAETDIPALRAALEAGVEAVLEDFLAMRASEGAALATLLADHLDTIARLTDAAAEAAEARRPEAARALREALARVMDLSEGADETRVAQELAMLAVKADVTEELGRLRAHVDAARDLLAKGSPWAASSIS